MIMYCTSSMRNQYPKKWTRKKAMMNLVVCHSSVLHAAWNEFDAKICFSRLPWRHHFMHPVWISFVSLSSCLIAPHLHLLNPFRCDSLWTGDLLAIEISKTSTTVDEIFTNFWGRVQVFVNLCHQMNYRNQNEPNNLSDQPNGTPP